MITEDYVSFETAKLLKEKGFDETCEMFYCKPHEGYLKNRKRDEWRNSNLRKDMTCTCPTIQMAMKWLREVHNWHIFVIPRWKDVERDVVGYQYVIVPVGNTNKKNEQPVMNTMTPESAYEAAIKYCLENLI